MNGAAEGGNQAVNSSWLSIHLSVQLLFSFFLSEEA